jgi:hypothetical protein
MWNEKFWRRYTSRLCRWAVPREGNCLRREDEEANIVLPLDFFYSRDTCFLSERRLETRQEVDGEGRSQSQGDFSPLLFLPISPCFQSNDIFFFSFLAPSWSISLGPTAGFDSTALTFPFCLSLSRSPHFPLFFFPTFFHVCSLPFETTRRAFWQRHMIEMLNDRKTES